MKHLVISVSVESSLELLGQHADIILLDKESSFEIKDFYETVYIRSHFSTPALQPLQFDAAIKSIVEQVLHVNPEVKFIDQMSTAAAITAFEDKWHQYELFSEFMPHTELLNATNPPGSTDQAIYKRRLSSRGVGVQWTPPIESLGDWVRQEPLSIAEELRVYVIRGEVYPVAAIRQSKTQEQAVQAVAYRQLSPEEKDFALRISLKAPDLDMIGLDIVRTSDDELKLLEVNRSPGFGAFEKLTEFNLADILYKNPA